MDTIKKVLNQTKEDGSSSSSNKANKHSTTTTLNHNKFNTRRPSKASSSTTRDSKETVALTSIPDETYLINHKDHHSHHKGLIVDNGSRRNVLPVQESSSPTTTPSIPVRSQVDLIPEASLVTTEPLAQEDTRKLVAPVTHTLTKRFETEEITREIQHDRHIHHIQHHVLPVKDLVTKEEVHHNKIEESETILENIEASAETAQLFDSLGQDYQDLEIQNVQPKVLVNRPDHLLQKNFYHIHNVIQPILEREIHDRHRIHTTIPVHRITHDAPIIHKSIQHEPLELSEFLERGGTLTSSTTHTEIGKQLLTQPLSSKIQPNET